MLRNLLLVAGIASTSLLSTESFGQYSFNKSKVESVFNTNQLTSVSLNKEKLVQILSQAGTTKETGVKIDLPTPDGNYRSFIVWKNTLIPQPLQDRYPSINAYSGVDVYNNAAVLKLELTTLGAYAMVFDKEQTYVVNPSEIKSDKYVAFYKKDYIAPASAINACQFTDDFNNELVPNSTPAEVTPQARTSSGSKKIYRFAVSNTVQYATAVAGPNPTKADVLSAMVTTINRVNSVYEADLSASLQFVDNQDSVVYVDAATVPFTTNQNLSSLLSQNRNNMNNVIGNANFDIGHIFCTSSQGGVAILRALCNSYSKAMGATGTSNPVGDPFDIDYVAHELGHQFGANHTFNVCSGTEEQSTAYEPGGGTTIMGYAGICGTTNNVAQNSSAYFHFASLKEINSHMTNSGPNGGNCGVTQTGVAAPNFTEETLTFYIPTKTPYEIPFPTVSGTEANSIVTWNVEQSNLGNFQEDENGGHNFVNGPQVRSIFSDTTSKRSIPSVASLMNSYNAGLKGERLSFVQRNLNYTFVARQVVDGWGGFKVSEQPFKIEVKGTGSPFEVTYPTTQDSVIKNAQSVVMWNVVNTTQAPISCNNVNILLLSLIHI